MAALPPARRWFALLLVVSIVGGCGSTAPSVTSPPGGSASASPGTGASRSPTGSASAGVAPSGSRLPDPTFGPLPAGTLTDPSDIATALLDPDRAGDAVVSLLDLLDWRGPLELSDPLVHGLVAMAVEDATTLAAGGEPATLADLHAAVAEAVPELTIEAMLATYRDAYAAAPDEPLPQVLSGVTFEASTVVSRAQLWFLLCDGFVAPVVGAARTQTAALGGIVVPGPLATRGLRQPPVSGGGSGLTALQVAQQLQLSMPLAFMIPFTLEPLVSHAHEGHGGPGPTVELKARHGPASVAVPFASPVWIASGLPVTFGSSSQSTLDDHGTVQPLLGLPTLTQFAGEATLTYQVKTEDGDQSGPVEATSVTVQATVPAQQLLLFNYVPVSSFMLAAAPGDRVAVATILVEWHQSAWTHTSSGGGSEVHGTKCGGIDGDWILEGTYEQAGPAGVQIGTNRWVVTVSEATMSGTYTYIDEATMDAGPVTVYLTGIAEGDATLTLESDGRIAMRLRDTKHTFRSTTDKGGQGVDTPAPLQLQIVYWEPGGTC